MSNEFLDLLESVKAEEASTQRLFNTATDGRGIRSMRRDDPRYKRSLSEAATLIEGVVQGRTPMHRLQEAMSTSDFPLLFGDVIDRSMLGTYEQWPSVWQQIAKRGSVKDFRVKRQFVMDGAEAPLDKVAQGTEYPESEITEGKYDYRVEKYGRRLPFLWEIFVNDDLDALRDMPQRLAAAARNTEERLATELYVDDTGPDATFFSGGNANVVAGNPSLDTPESLQAAYTVIRTQKDTEGNPIWTGRLRLVVPPTLEITARNLLNATQIVTAPGATTGQQVQTKNWMSEVCELVVNPWLPIVNSTNGTSAWFLFAEPTVGRPAMEVGFLRGHNGPELFMKTPNATRIGGGMVGAEEGSFETDGIDYKVRHVVGGGLLEPKAAVASNGTDS